MLDQLGGVLVGILSLLVVLGVVVFVHEFGHFQVGRWCNVKVDTFSIGFGKEVIGRTSKSGTRWRLSALPLGGYVKFAGDADESSRPDLSAGPADKSSGFLHAQSVGVRSAVAAAGPIANFIFAILVFAVIFGIYGERIDKAIITSTVPNGAAEQAGMKAGDVVVKIDGKKIADFNALQSAVMVSGGKELAVLIDRGGQDVLINVTPQIIPKETPFGDMETQGILGIRNQTSPATTEFRKYNPVQAVVRGADKTWTVITMQVKFIGALLRGGMSPGHLSGPLGIGQIAGKVTQNGVEGAGPGASPLAVAESVAMSLVQLMAVLSVSVGFMNLLPLPVLDGGHLVFYAAEAIRGKPIPEKVQAVCFRIGLGCLLSLFVFATFQDLERGGLFNLLKGVVAAG